MGNVIIKIAHEVDLSSDEAQAIYTACAQALLDGEFQGEISPLGISSRDGVACVVYQDIGSDVDGSLPLADAVSRLMIFDEMDLNDDADDICAAVKDAEVIASSFEEQAARLRSRIRDLKAS